MQTHYNWFHATFISLLIISLSQGVTQPPKPKYSEDIAFLKKHTTVIQLIGSDHDMAIAICPAYQGRVMTSTTSGSQGHSNGWLNKPVIEQKKPKPGGNPYGGEDRLWIGPLGSQHSLYYQQIKPLSSENWYIPVPFDAEPFTVDHLTAKEVQLSHSMALVNFIGTQFNIKIKRTIRLYEISEIQTKLDVTIPSTLKCVGYESINRMTNTGDKTWSRKTGLLSIWNLGMFQGREEAFMLLPVQEQASLADINFYLGKLDEQRVRLHNNCVWVKADGRYRSKVCIPPHIVKPIMGSYDPEVKRLTLIQFQYDGGTYYFNSDDTIQDNPYIGEVVHTYNNGDKDTYGFYELESTSPCVALTPGESKTHYQRIYHFIGPIEVLNELAQNTLGISLVP